MEFRTAYTKEKSKPSIAGNKEVQTFKVRLTATGKKTLVKKDKINIYEKTQQDKEEADIHTIINRAKAGDVKSLEMLQTTEKGGLIDLTQVPNNLIEAKQKLIDAENTWNSLDKDLKKHFNNNLDEFIAGVNDGRVKAYLEAKIPKKEDQSTQTTTQTKEESL